MRLQLTLHEPATGRLDDVVVDADPDTPIDEVAEAIATVGRGHLFVRGRPLVPHTAPDGEVLTLARSGLRDGDILSLGQPEPPPIERHAPLELAVIGGPLAGLRWPLPPGEWVIGRDETATLRLPDASLSRHHASLRINQAGGTLVDLNSTNGTFVNGNAITEPMPITPETVFEVGASLLRVRPPVPADADLHIDEDGTVAYNRPARIRRPEAPRKVALPDPPNEIDKWPFPWVQAIAPIAVAGLMAYLFKRPEAMIFATLSPIMVLSSAMTTRKRGSKKNRADKEKFERETKWAEEQIAAAVKEETANLHHDHPDPAAVGAMATGPNRQLWERRAHDVDALTLRVGLASLPASIEVQSRQTADKRPDPVLPPVPVVVDLKHAGVLGVAGTDPQLRACARWLVAELAALHSPRNLGIMVLTNAELRQDWEWVRWLPHARVDIPGYPLAMIGNDRVTRDQRVKELLKLIEERAEVARDVDAFEQSIVVVFDGIRAMRATPGVPRILKEGPALGIYAICLDSEPNRLPEEGRAELLLSTTDPSLATLRVDGRPPVHDLVVDQVMPAWSLEVARALAPLRDAGGEEAEAVIPNAVRFVELANVSLDDPEDVAGRWLLGGRTTQALVGVSVDGPFSIDLKADGPHGLVAGTTGAGKSEFLQTMVASLALANRPDAINFVLVDYKGASAFADCERLPHTVGMVTNLDGHLTERALESLDAELKRRELVLKELRAGDVDTAWEHDPERAAALGMARLVLVIDEFAELVQELPDFVSGLIRIARVGRSLGVHLILATQRPAGVVTGEMKANTGLRVALRVQDKPDSTEVLEAPDAASISRATPGRAYVKTGGASSLIQFQTARVAGRRKGTTEGIPKPHVGVVGWERLAYPPPARRKSEEKGDSRATDLHALVEVIRAAAEKLEIPLPRRPWLPALEPFLTLDEASAGLPPVEGVAPVPYGRLDIPADQRQVPAALDLVNGGHLLLAGSARSGRSTALRTIAGSIARTCSPSDVHLYGLDFGNGALLPLSHLPHTGVVVARSETGRIERLISKLNEEVIRRQELFALQGFGDIGEQRQQSSPDERLPYIVVLLDRWEGFTSTFPPEAASDVPPALMKLVREGPGAGVRVVIAGDRSILTDRVASQIEERLVMRLSEKNDYRLANINPKHVPEEMTPGRALTAERSLEVQIATLTTDPAGQAQAEAIRAIGREAEERWPKASRRNKPLRVDVMPRVVPFDDAWRLAAEVRPDSPLWALVGVGGDELTAFGVDLATSGPGFVVAGPGKTGRSSALAALGRSFLAGGATLLVWAPRTSPLEAFEGVDGVRAVVRGIPPADDLRELLAQPEGALAVLIDDAQAIARSDADDVLKEVMRERGVGRLAVAIAGELDELKNELRGTIVEARKAKLGLLLSPPSSLDGDVVGVRLARSQTGRAGAGRGWFAEQSETTLVQVPLVQLP